MPVVFMIVELAARTVRAGWWGGLLECCAGPGALARCNAMEWRLLFALIPARSADTAYRPVPSPPLVQPSNRCFFELTVDSSRCSYAVVEPQYGW